MLKKKKTKSEDFIDDSGLTTKNDTVGKIVMAFSYAMVALLVFLGFHAFT